MEKLYKEFGREIEFIGINLGTKGKIGDFVREYGLTFPVGYDEGYGISSAFGAKIETNILIDRKGVIAFKSRDFQEDMGTYLKKLSER
ncbi:MAG: TlpA family protein disulfide reductase [Nitrospirae bacterium]|nr:TlpA family protein disulfide reductase [Nitrospirota bacterium]